MTHHATQQDRVTAAEHTWFSNQNVAHYLSSCTLVSADGYTYLHAAAKTGEAGWVSLLLEHEASVTAVYNGSDTPLILAARYNKPEVIGQLVAIMSRTIILSVKFTLSADEHAHSHTHTLTCAHMRTRAHACVSTHM